MEYMPYVISDSLKLHYEIHGQGDPLVLIHGLGSSCRDWELQIPAFAEGFQVITLDLRGHGRSDKPAGPYSMALFAEDTAQLISSLGLQTVHVLGISLGGMVAIQLGLDFPDLVRSLVIVNSTPEMVPRTFQERISIWQRWMIVRFSGMKKMGQVLAERFLPRDDQAELRKIFIQRWAENHKPAYLEAMKAVIGWSVRERLGEISCPTLIIGSDGDYFPTSDKQAYTELIPGARLVIVKDSRHALPAEKPVEFNRLVIDFLAGLSSPRSEIGIPG
jgi:3-oxoadipate enol-lactonase